MNACVTYNNSNSKTFKETFHSLRNFEKKNKPSPPLPLQKLPPKQTLKQTKKHNHSIDIDNIDK